MKDTDWYHTSRERAESLIEEIRGFWTERPKEPDRDDNDEGNVHFDWHERTQFPGIGSVMTSGLAGGSLGAAIGGCMPGQHHYADEVRGTRQIKVQNARQQRAKKLAYRQGFHDALRAVVDELDFENDTLNKCNKLLEEWHARYVQRQLSRQLNQQPEAQVPTPGD